MADEAIGVPGGGGGSLAGGKNKRHVVDTGKDQLVLSAFNFGHLDRDHVAGGTGHIAEVDGRHGRNAVESEFVGAGKDRRPLARLERLETTHPVVDVKDHPAVGVLPGHGKGDLDTATGRECQDRRGKVTLAGELRDGLLEDGHALAGDRNEWGRSLPGVEVEDVGVEQAAAWPGDLNPGQVGEKGGLVEAIAERLAGVVDGSDAVHDLVAAAKFEKAAEVDDIPVGIDAADGVLHADEDLTGTGGVENRGGTAGFGEGERTVEARHRGQQTAHEHHDQGEVTDERAVLAPGVALGEEACFSGGVAQALDPVVAPSERCFQLLNIAGEIEAGAVMGRLEVAVGNIALRPVNRPDGWPDAADGTNRDGCDDHAPEGVEPPLVIDIEETEAVHGAGKPTEILFAQGEPGGLGSRVALHFGRKLRNDDADHPDQGRGRHEDEGELDVGEEPPGTAEGVQAAAAGGRLFDRAGGGHQPLSSAWRARICSRSSGPTCTRRMTPAGSRMKVIGKPRPTR